MLDPFVDTTQKELREAWNKIERLEEENRKLQEEIEGKDGLIKYLEGQIEQYQNNKEELEKENKELRELLEKERELYYGDDDFADDDWGRE